MKILNNIFYKKQNHETKMMKDVLDALGRCRSVDIDQDKCEGCPYYSELPKCKKWLFHDFLYYLETEKLKVSMTFKPG